ncbi:peptidoglycan-binding domain-containing protein [Streptomyces sp. NPDC048269]|uniref:peptidoglycan-binding domain-containing protein n=1 Tax=Streptomyces sp. NPDC048269 TaxID=3155753 RepID=UPI00344294B4
MTLPDPGEPDDDAPAPPVARVVVPPPRDDTPAYGIPVAPGQPWPDGPAPAPLAAETARLHPLPEPGSSPGGAEGGGASVREGEREGGGGGGGGGGGPEKRTGPGFRRLLPLLIAAIAVVALGGTAVALWALPSSAGSDTALLDAQASAPVTSPVPAEPSRTPAPGTTGPSPSVSPSPSPSASKSTSPSPSPSASRSSTPPSPSPSPTPPRAPSPTPPPPQAPTLRYGDSGSEVEKLQRLLAARGLFTYKINGKFDWRVENAVSTFQYDNNIDEDEWGVYGPATRKALEG